MTRQEYLAELKNELYTLPVEEQEEALEFYRGYFEDADNDEEVMREFGSPEELARSIREKFASVPDVRHRPQENKEKDGSYGGFGSDEVRSLDISLGAAEIVMAGGESFSVDYRGLEPGDIKCSVTPFGTLTIENTSSLPNLRNFSFWSHHSNGRLTAHPRILIKVPQGAKLDLLRLHVGAGEFRSKDVSLVVARSYIDVGAGSIALSTVKGGAAELHCGMGSISYGGTLTGLIKADCGMGSISLNLAGSEADYSLTAKVGLGSVRFNNLKKEGIGSLESPEVRQNHFSVNCGVGAVTIKMEE